MITLCWKPAPGADLAENDKVEDFRRSIAGIKASWPTVWNAYAEKVVTNCDCGAALVSLLGASQSGSTVTVLGSWGPDAAVLCSGRVLPSPWRQLPGPTVQSQKVTPPLQEEPVEMPTALTWKGGSQLSLPYEWHQLLDQARFSETLVLHGHLEPLLLGGTLVGALLLVTCAGVLPHVREGPVVSVPFTSPSSWTGSGRGSAAKATSASKGLLQKLKLKNSPTAVTSGAKAAEASGPSPRLLRDMAAALSQMAFGPHLHTVSRVCSGAQALAAAASLYELSSVLSSMLSEVLAAEFYVNLAIRVAVVPPLHVQYGYLLPLDSPVAAAVATAADTGLNGDNPVKRAASGALLVSCVSTSARVLRTGGRAGSFSGQVPLSGPNVLLSAPGGTSNKVECGRATPFVLPSSLLMQLLRPAGGNRGASVHAGASNHANGRVSYHPEEPTVRSMVIPPKAYAATNAVSCTATTASTKESSFIGRGNTFSVNSANGAGCATGAVSGMVVANLHAWMQDVERPSSDVALLMMSGRGKGGPWGPGPGRPSQGGAGGGPHGGGPACMVALAGSAIWRPATVALGMGVNQAVAGTGSVHIGTASAKQANSGDDPWISSLDTSQRRYVGNGALAGEMSLHRGGNSYWYSGGSVRYDGGGVGSGPCVALYIMSQERLPTSLLRAVKDRAAGLLELLLPACLGSLSMGPLRTEIDLLAASGCAGAGNVTGGGTGFTGSSARRILAVVGSGSGLNPSVASAAIVTPSTSACATPLPSTQISGSHTQFSQLQLQMQMQMLATGRASVGACSSSPRRGAYSCGAEEGMLMPSSVRSPLGLPTGQAVSMPVAQAVSSCVASPVLLPQAAGASRAVGGGISTMAGTEPSCTGGGGIRGSDGEANSRLIPMLGSSRDLSLIAQQRWPDGGAGVSAAQVGMGRGYSHCSAQPGMPRTTPSSQSRTTRGSPGSCGFGAGVEECGLMASIDVTGAMDDVTSMRDNLDVWVHSFWEMLRDAPPNKSGHTHGSYADDDLRYLRIYQRLGSGGAASVYAGVLLGMDVAVKVIEPPPEVDVEALAGSRPQGASGSSGQPAARGSAGPEGEGQGGEGAEEERMAELAAAVRQAQMLELVRSARECAVLTSVSHPAIVQVYSYHTRVQVVPGEGPNDLPRLVPVPAGEAAEQQGPLHSVLVMERCDLGCLADALDNGMFKKAIIAAANSSNNNTGLAGAASSAARSVGGGAGRPQHPASGGLMASGAGSGFTFASSTACGGGGSAMRAIYLTLLEVALALRHLHSMNLVHCDVKVANILLKSSASDPRGFTCKLSDFGLVNLLRSEEEPHEQGHEQEQEQNRESGSGRREGAVPGRQVAAEGRRAMTAGWESCKPWMRNADAAGTVTHLAPECFEQDRKLDQSVDIYAFGIVMWEVFTRKPPYAEYAPDFEGLPARVLEGLRLRFPSHCPSAYKALAQACWCRDPARRPTAASVVNCLQHLLEGGQL